MLSAVVLILETTHLWWLLQLQLEGQITACASRCVTADWCLYPATNPWIQPLIYVRPALKHCMRCDRASKACEQGMKGDKTGSQALTHTDLATSSCWLNKAILVHSKELPLCQRWQLSKKIKKKNKIQSLWPMDLVQGLFCGKTSYATERSGRQLGTDYSLCRHFITGSIWINFLSMFPSCFNLLNQPKEPQSFQLEKETADHAKSFWFFSSFCF